MITRVEQFSERGAIIEFKTRLFYRVAWSLIAWAMLAFFALLLVVCIVDSSTFSRFLAAAGQGWGFIAGAVFAGISVLAFPLIVAASSYNLAIDVESRKYKLRYGILPFQSSRSGNLSDFAQVDLPYPRSSLTCVRLLWRDPSMCYRIIGGRITLARTYDEAEADEFGRSLAAKLDLPFVGLQTKTDSGEPS